MCDLLLFALDLTDCNRNPYDGESFAKVITPCPQLTNLNLNGNLIDTPGEEILAGLILLPQASSLPYLHVRGNFLTSKGTMMLLRVLEKCQSLTHLDLGCNVIGKGDRDGFRSPIHNLSTS